MCCFQLLSTSVTLKVSSGCSHVIVFSFKYEFARLCVHQFHVVERDLLLKTDRIIRYMRDFEAEVQNM